MLIASRIEAWATPNLAAQVPSTIRSPGRSVPFHDFRAQQIGKGLFQKSFGRMAGLHWHLSARMGTFSHHIPRPL